MTPEQQYVATLSKLVEAMQVWGDSHQDELIDIHFPEDETVVIGELQYMPQEWLKNDAAREMIRYLIETVPEGTIEQLRTICEGIAQAEANASPQKN